MLTEQERDRLLISWNDTAAEYPRNRCIHQMFESQAERTPESVAAIFEDRQLTYRELNARADRLACHLQGLGVGPEILVGLCIERSLEMIVAMLGILKAGGAYVPLDPAYPSDRLAFMLEDAGLSVVVTQDKIATNFLDSTARSARTNLKLVCLDADWQEISQSNRSLRESAVRPDNLAYVIYTSGSTGRPKGVEVTHGSVVNFLSSMGVAPGLTERDVLLAVTTISFDIAVLEIYLPLVTGARCVLVSRETTRDAARLTKLIAECNASVIQATPAAWRMLLEAGWSGSKHIKILCGGERLTRDLADRLLEKSASLWNMYGPTEATVWSAIYRVTPSEDPVSIGRPIANTQIYILDPDGKLVPVGESGELHIGGAGLARGYSNRPELTKEKFIPNPFCREPDSRLYKTGDLARYLPDGNIEFLGRIDHQVKVRGHRIELGEIETVLNRHAGVLQSVVVVSGSGRAGEASSDADKRLVAYAVPDLHYQGDDGEEKTASQEEQVSQWQELWDLTYRQDTRESDPTFNINGWNDSYTGAPIPAPEMREWLEGTVGRIRSCRPQRVLEIGCGTGMLLFRVAPHCRSYYGIDLAPTALRYIEAQMEKMAGDWSHVKLWQGAADAAFDRIQPGELDLVVINSVVQLFPSIDYLVEVLAKAVEAVGPNGTIFVGDVRSLPLQEAFHASIQLLRSPDELPKDTLQKRVRKSIAGERQMTIDPAFFSALQQKLPQISQVDVQLRRGRSPNEMSKFRYDAIVRVGKDAARGEPHWLDWQEAKLTLAEVRDRLVRDEPKTLGIQRVPNARVLAEVKLFELLERADGPATAGDLRQALPEFEEKGIEPEDWWSLGDGLPYRIAIGWSAGETGCYDVLFQHDATADRPVAISPPTNGRVEPWTAYANDPLSGQVASRLEPELRHYLRERLPDYMLPAAFVILDEMPLTPNGKVNRRALPEPELSRPQLATALVMPQSDTEKAIAKVWQDLLRLEVVGVNDNFFELGGNSLLLTQVHQKLATLLNDASLSIVTLFQYPTIAALAESCDRPQGSQPASKRPDPSGRRSRKTTTQQQKQRRQHHRRDRT